MATADELRSELDAQHRRGRPHAEINAGELHRRVGGYPPKAGASGTMPMCCDIIWQEYRRGGRVPNTKWSSSALTIKY